MVLMVSRRGLEGVSVSWGVLFLAAGGLLVGVDCVPWGCSFSLMEVFFS
jgi:hypothetical protein